MNRELSRRDFLTTAAVGTLGATAVGALGATALGALTGCADTGGQPGAGTGDATTGSPAEGQDATWGSILNPQEDFGAATTDYGAIFSPLNIAHVTLKNRIVKSCAGSEMQKSMGWPDDTSLRFYEQFCKGGVGMVCFETSTITLPPVSGEASEGDTPDIPGVPGGMPEGVVMGSLDITSDEGIPAHKVVADLMHGYDVPVIAQMVDMFMYTGGSSTFVENTTLETAMAPPLMQTTEQVNAQQKAFIDAAERYHTAGFDGIELNCSCNHYFSTFLSRYANHERSDQYSGASVENRARIVTEIIEGIRDRVGQDFIIQVLYSGVEGSVVELGFDEQCTTLDEACEMARLFEKAGASCLHIRSELYGHHCGGFMPDIMHYHEHGDTGYASVIDYGRHIDGALIGAHDGVGALLEVAARIKSQVSIPVGAVGSMDPRLAPDLLNNAIRDGKLDYLLMTRPLMADPAIANKLKEGRRDEVAPCAHCMTCFVAPFDFGTPMFCRVNPAITRAYSEDMPEGYDPAPAVTSKKVMVIGGGPAGMEAARIAAQRGHEVTLYEKRSEFSGLMNLAMRVKGPHERIADYTAYLIRQQEVNGVKVVSDREVDLDFVSSEAPDAVIVAVGGLFNTLDIPGSDAANVLSLADFYEYGFTGDAPSLGDSVLIYGAQLQACDMAEYLVKLGKKVTILNPGPEGELYRGGPTWPRMMGRIWLRAKGVKIYHDIRLREIAADGAVFDTGYGTVVTLPFDQLIDVRPLLSNRELFEAIQDVCGEVRAVGDCYSPGTIANATARAHIIARRIGDGGGDVDEELAANQYAATALGIGDVTVTITVDGGVITAATVDTSNETDGIGRGLGPRFAEQIVSVGAIDAVSGATMTSDATASALEDCKQQAGI
jgi:2,4-dienoyl-CoA reductase-like NADH-dependent reductase (Old Yellow Enzyme family)/NADPH-dependent 2,4-dienoyl-CoA reductase/sulfur reductase-like enzyme